MKILIGLTGKARTGKDTLAEALESYGFSRYAFADPIRLAVSAILDEPGWRLFSDGLKEKPIYDHWPEHITPRFLMQTLGTEWGRQIVDRDIWLRLGQARWARTEKSMVISDVRFENEAQWIRAAGGQVWHVSRRTAQTIGGVPGHASESGVQFQSGDLSFDNSGTKDGLLLWARERVKELNSLGYR